MGQLTKKINQVDRENESIREQLRLAKHRASKQKALIEKLYEEIDSLRALLANSDKIKV